MASEQRMTGDVVNGNKGYTGGGAAEEYYKYALLKAKAETSNDSRLTTILKSKSEREEIEIDTLNKLVQLGESSPEFSQVAEITGSRDKFEMAKILSEIVYDKARAEQILSFYTPTKDKLNSHFLQRTAESFAVRGERIAGALVASKTGPAVLFVKALGFPVAEA